MAYVQDSQGYSIGVINGKENGNYYLGFRD